MSIENISNFSIYFLSLFISLGVSLIAWRRREVAGARIYAISAISQVTIIVGYILELANSTLERKLFWDDFQWFGLLIYVVLFPIFSLQFTGSERGFQFKWWLLFFIVPAFFSLLIFTNQYHGLIHQNAWIEPGIPFSALRYEFTPTVWAFAIYSYGVMTIAFINLLINYFQIQHIYRLQVGTVIVGVGIPLAGTLLTLLGFRFGFQRDITPITMAIGNLFVGWGLYQYRLFDIVPIARDMVFESLDDFVFVLDIKGRVVDLNPVASKRLFRDNGNIIGESWKEIFRPWQNEIHLPEDFQEGRVELLVPIDGQPTHFDVHGTKIVDQHQKELGRVFVARNVTRQKELENELRLLNAELEDRVIKRTKELAEAYDNTLEGWGIALEYWDKETEGHSRRVTELTLKVASALAIPEEEMLHIKRGSLLHDIGKMGVPHEIINKSESLTPDEWVVMKKHPTIGRNILEHINFLEPALEIPSYHHERWDGKGYPYGLKGEEIPISARIFSLVDHWDALISDRPYRKAWDKPEVVEYIKENSGKIFDPDLVDVFLKVVGG